MTVKTRITVHSKESDSDAHKYSIQQTAKILISIILHAKKVRVLTNFCNPKIPELGRRQSRDSRLAKTTGIPGFGIPGLQSLVVTRGITVSPMHTFS